MKLIYPKWFPYPGSWLNAILLGLLSIVITFMLGGIATAAESAGIDSSEQASYLWLSCALILSPILTIAWFHHLVHRFLTRFLPSLEAPEIGKTRGSFPGLFSWWEGVYGWAVIMISSLLTTMYGIATVPDVSHLSAYLHLEEINRHIEGFVIGIVVCWIVCAAYLYQLSYLAEQRMIKFGKNQAQETK